MIEWSWHNAMTLAERARLPRGARADSTSRDNERGRKRLAKWKSRRPFDSDHQLEQRLLQAGLTEAEFLELLSDSPGASQEALLEPPAWAAEIASAFADSLSSELSLGIEGPRTRPQYRFLELVRPLIARSRCRLRDGIHSLPAVPGALPVEADAVEDIFVSLLPDRLLSIILRTMVLELNVARVEGSLAGETGEERFESFIHHIKQPQKAFELLCEYPVLGRQVALALENWVSCSLEFLRRWSADWTAICRAFGSNAEPGPLLRIEDNVGDRHRNGRAVWIVECRSGLKLVYKPKPMGVDQHFQEMLQWLNDHHLTAPFRLLRILDRGRYGWEEFVEAKGCQSGEEVVRFYERSGGYLALLYALAATDFHQANVLAMGEHPMLVDLEALFHPAGLEQASPEASEIAGQTFLESVLGSGLLPAPTWSERAGGAFDVSGLGGAVGWQSPTRVPAWEASGTDRMLFARKLEMAEFSAHCPTLNGVAVSPIDYLDAMEKGFKQVYGLLQTHKAELIAAQGLLERFARDEVRVVLRNTSMYAELLQESSHPDVLRDALERDRLFDRLWDDVNDRPRLAELIPAETEALWRGDIPLFTGQPASRDLWADQDRCFKNFLDECGLERARRRLGQLSDDDLERQIWFLRGSLTTLASRARVVPRVRQPHEVDPGPAFGREDFLTTACAVGDRLLATAFHGAGEVTWIGLSLMREKKWILAPLGIDLYDGVAGIGLFLAYLGAVSGQERYTSLARATLDTVRHKLRAEQPRRGLSELGGFTGWGGVLYMLTHLAVLWNEPDLLAEAQEMIETLPPKIEKDQDLDIISGAAGCIAGLLCLHGASPTARVLQVAVQCGDHLLAQARPALQGLGWDAPARNLGPLTGFSHGAAGISLALLELAARTHEDRFRMAALAGIAYERSLFSIEAENWPDLRELDVSQKRESSKPPFQVTWCHGAPGIGIGRLRCRPFGVPSVDEEIAAALRTTVAKGFGSNHCLCHGDLGNLDLLLEAAKVWPESPWGLEAARLATGILQSIGRDGWLCGNPLAVESPGLMTGIAGIGYGLLRCAEPVTVPSILCIAPPIPRPSRATGEG